MKFLAEKNVLVEAIVNASKACAPKTNLNALDGILVNVKGNVLSVTGYDLEMGIRTMIPVDGREDGEIVLNSRIFAEMIRKMPAGEPIEIYTENEVNVIIKAGKVRYNVIGISGNEFPNLPVLGRNTCFDIKESVLKSMIAQTSYAISTTDTKPVHMGSKFDIVNNELRVVSTDGVRLAKRVEKIDYQDTAFVVPSKTLAELQHILSEDNTETVVNINVDRNQICFSKEDYLIISRILEGDFIDYNRVMEFTPITEAVVNVRDFMASLERTTLLITDRFKSPAVCTFENDLLSVNCKTILGVVDDEIVVKYPYPKFEIAFNAKFMLDALRFSFCDEVKLQFTNPLKAIRIVPLGEEDFTFLVLPVRLK